MKLRNKKTGEILLIGNIIVENPKKIDCGKLTKCSSLAELNAEWEDYEPKVFYYINENGGVLRYIPSDPEGEDETYIKYQNEIGNYFETLEEAEKAVRKLEAWKVLKDMGFKIEGIRYRNNKSYIEWSISQKVRDDHFASEAFNDALHLLFGGEE